MELRELNGNRANPHLALRETKLRRSLLKEVNDDVKENSQPTGATEPLAIFLEGCALIKHAEALTAKAAAGSKRYYRLRSHLSNELGLLYGTARNTTPSAYSGRAPRTNVRSARRCERTTRRRSSTSSTPRRSIRTTTVPPTAAVGSLATAYWPRRIVSRMPNVPSSWPKCKTPLRRTPGKPNPQKQFRIKQLADLIGDQALSQKALQATARQRFHARPLPDCM